MIIMNWLQSCIEEIALEGLEGITIPNLWLRIENLKEKFPLALNHFTKAHVWKTVLADDGILVYELPEPWTQKVIDDRFKQNHEMEMIVEVVSVEPLKFHMVNEEEVLGSCSTYHTRKDITCDVRENGKVVLSVDEAFKRWGEKLVLVASQELRWQALIGEDVDPTVQVSGEHYCILEQIGKARGQGETSMRLGEACKDPHHLTLSLLSSEIIRKQKFVYAYQSNGGLVRVTVAMYHLTRFFVNRCSRNFLLIQKVAELLGRTPGNIMSVESLQETFPDVSSERIKKIVETGKDHWRIVRRKLSELYPSVDVSNSRIKDSKVRAIQLAKPWPKDDEDECEDDATGPPFHALLNRSYITHVMSIMEQRGSRGISASELTSVFGIHHLEARALFRHFRTRPDEVSMKLVEHKKTKTHVYVARQCEKVSVSQKVEEVLLNFQDNTPKKESSTNLSINQAASPIIMDETSKSVSPGTSNVKEAFQHTLYQKNSALTMVKLRRVQTILDAVKKDGFVERVMLWKLVRSNDTANNMSAVMCRRSLNKLVSSLEKDKKIRVVNKEFHLEHKKNNKLDFVCLPSMSDDDPAFNSYIQSVKLQKAVSHMNTLNTNRAEGGVAPTPVKVKSEDIIRDYSIPAKVGYLPKLRRMELMHKYLFYLYFEHPNNESGPLKSESEEPPVYVDEMSFKRFLPPLNGKDVEGGYKRAQLFEIIKIMPLCIYVQIVRIVVRVEGLMEYLQDPIKKFYPVTCLPERMVSILFFGRRHVYSTSATCETLCHMGLLSYLASPAYMDREFEFIILHHRGSLIDTSGPRMPELEDSESCGFAMKTYYLATGSDVESFWIDMRNICLHTTFDTVKAMRNVTKRDAITLKDSLKKINEEDLNDTGRIPGNGQGVAGMDSQFTWHKPFVWFGPGSYNFDNALVVKANKRPLSKDNVPTPAPVKAKKPKLSEDKKTQASNKTAIVQPRITMTTAKPTKGGKGMKRKPDASHAPAPPKRLRNLKPKPPKKPKNEKKKRVTTKNIYDDKDMQIVKELDNRRVMWSPSEDSLILLSYITSSSLMRYSPRLNRLRVFVGWNVVRDMIHKYSAKSRCKPSSAVQRRTSNLMKNPQTQAACNVFITEALNDPAMQEFTKPLKETDSEARKNAYDQLFVILKDKFNKSLELKSRPDLPDTVEGIYDKFSVSKAMELKANYMFQEPQCERDIHFSVLTNIIEGYISIKDKTSRAYEMYKLFSQYPDNLLRSVVDMMNKHAILTKTKKDKNRSMQAKLAKSSGNEGGYVKYYKLTDHFTHRFTIKASKFYPKIFKDGVEFFKLLKQAEKWLGCEIRKESNPGGAVVGVALSALKKLDFHLDFPDEILGNSTRTVTSSAPSGLMSKQSSLLTPLTGKDSETSIINQGKGKALLSGRSSQGIKGSAPTIENDESSSSNNDQNKHDISVHIQSQIDRTSECQDVDINPKGQSTDNISPIIVEADAPAIVSDVARISEPFGNAQMEAISTVDSASNVANNGLDSLKPLGHVTVSESETSVVDKTWDSSKESGSVSMLEAEMNVDDNSHKVSNQSGNVSVPESALNVDDDSQELANQSGDVTMQEFGVNDDVNADLGNDSYGKQRAQRRKKLRPLWQYKGRNISIPLDRLLVKLCPLSIRLKNPTAEGVRSDWTSKSDTSDEHTRKVSLADEEGESQLVGERHSSANFAGLLEERVLTLDTKLMKTILTSTTIIEPKTLSYEGFEDTFRDRYQLTDDQLRGMKELFHSIQNGGICGLTLKDVLKLGQCSTTLKYLNWLLEGRVVLRVGVTEPKYVSYDNAKPWLAYSLRNTRGRGTSSKKAETVPATTSIDTGSPTTVEENDIDSQTTHGDKSAAFSSQLAGEEPAQTSTDNRLGPKSTYDEVQLISRPWKKPEGTLNKDVFSMMVTGVLSNIMAQPGITWRHLVTKFSPFLQPVPLLELIEILEKLKCIHSVKIKPVGKCTLFSKRRMYQTCDNFSGEETIVYNPSVDCILRMGQFLQYING